MTFIISPANWPNVSTTLVTGTVYGKKSIVGICLQINIMIETYFSTVSMQERIPKMQYWYRYDELSSNVIQLEAIAVLGCKKLSTKNDIKALF